MVENYIYLLFLTCIVTVSNTTSAYSVYHWYQGPGEKIYYERITEKDI